MELGVSLVTHCYLPDSLPSLTTFYRLPLFAGTTIQALPLLLLPRGSDSYPPLLGSGLAMGDEGERDLGGYL